MASLLGVAIMFIGGCQPTTTADAPTTGAPSPVSMNCDAPDNINSVAAGELCLGVRVFGAEAASTSPVLIVLLHGDVSDGGPADYMYPAAQDISSAHPEAIVAHLLRPGYDDGQGRRSTGQAFGRRDHYTAANVDAIAAAIENLADHYTASRVVVLGHSGGAAMAGVMLGRHPEVADAALLLSCPCDIDRWRAERNRSAWTRSESPSAYIDRIPTTLTVVAMTGSGDTTTQPHLARDYIEALQERGVAAEFIRIGGGSHGFRTLWNSLTQTTLADLVME